MKNPVAIQNPSGTWSFVGGGIPSDLAFIRADGEAPTEKDMEIARHCGPGFAKLRTRSWDTEEAALAALAER